jgi:hypothetical protein
MTLRVTSGHLCARKAFQNLHDHRHWWSLGRVAVPTGTQQLLDHVRRLTRNIRPLILLVRAYQPFQSGGSPDIIRKGLDVLTHHNAMQQLEQHNRKRVDAKDDFQGGGEMAGEEVKGTCQNCQYG